jgi:hypothetical protein
MEEKNEQTCCHACTYLGLHEWYKSAIEKLGWMVIKKNDGCEGIEHKLSNYICKLVCLYNALQCKIDCIKCPEKKCDLEIMKRRVDIILTHAQTDLGVAIPVGLKKLQPGDCGGKKQSGGSRKKQITRPRSRSRSRKSGSRK